MKKFLSILFFLLLMVEPFGNLSVHAGTYGALNEEAFALKISQLKAQYPDGKFWNTYNGVDSEGIALAGNQICSGYNHASGKSCVNEGYCGIRSSAGCSCNCGRFHGWQCHGFANLMAYKLFGSYAISTATSNSGLNSSKGWTYSTSVSEYYAGDFVRINNFGHSIFIYKVDGNTVSYVDCNATGVPCQIDWDKTISVSALKSKTSYVAHLNGNTLKGTADEDQDLTIEYEDIAPGKYFIKSKSNGNYLNVAYGEDEDLTELHLYPYGNYDSQVYDIYRVSEGYEMMPLVSTTRVVNPYCWTVESGKIVNLYSKTDESSQWWRFQPVENGYVIRNVQNPKVCLTSSDNIIVETYTGANNQIWYLEEACTIQYDANGGSKTPASQRVRAGYQVNLSSQQPIKQCHIFTGWSLDKNGNVANWEEESDITTYEDITLYAVWDSNHTYSSSADNICNSCGFERELLFALGDVNGNGEITAEDALLALQATTKKINLSVEATMAADVNKKEGVTAVDALSILQYATKKIAGF